ncbi:unnamed protein product [Blepharisma stoltei]|uniref:Snurportin-1 n=1 Tax=Blepharisma stoltei TaxID=1481888 RepID=A0AAU9ILI6_9CILI|nr:unnamed protein product [Blepharisma stoltei]
MSFRPNRAFIPNPNYNEKDSNRRFNFARKLRNDQREKFREKNQGLGEFSDENSVFYCNQIMTEDYLTSLDYIDGINFLVMPRPLGEKCLLVTKNGRTYLYGYSGFLIMHFQSFFPVDDLDDDFIILDCIFNQDSNTIFIQDIQLWERQNLCDIKAEDRLTYLKTKLEEIDTSTNRTNYQFQRLPWVSANNEGLSWVYFSQWPFPRDGITFYNKSGSYVHGLNPDVLIWKDSNCSIDCQIRTGNIEVMLRAKFDGSLQTLEGYTLFKLDKKIMRKNEICHWSVLKCYIWDLDWESHDPKINRLEVIAATDRIHPYSWRQVLFLYLFDINPITYGMIEQALATQMEYSERMPILYLN